ncbi:MAG: OB-fold nucleic acid binding domain-containing protein, partial [Myxococcota bacterium]
MGLSAEKTIFVHDLEADTLVESLFLVEERQEGRTRRGERYLKLRLSDRTGSIEGRVWNGAPGLDVVFRSGDVIAVQARVERWRGVLQLNIAQIERAELDISPAAFIPTSRFEPREMLEQ